ncbi:unnamed protein product (macronuclear) [Paramecium tetraurelia]|uniref:Cytochrome P450 n=1 Tax=Paramecium tetraurelia TaxID=5888 RepID=A0DEY8_PARTE|nr:uncharacterized protein GSPATT00016431001 [Paramecium tetraurelia]CAK81605.1 unnamed protein product [Paramecium tetraurelia]|eukprot:XP_001449002.1 hypothetical protein (macronuclear) [Paramecium tetraurelia strain d4-2]
MAKEQLYTICSRCQELLRTLSQSRAINGDAFEALSKRIGDNRQADILVTNLLFRPMIVFLKPKYYRIFMQQHQDYTKFPMIVDKRLMTKGMIMEGGAKWLQQRRLLGTHFEYNKLINLIPMINDVAQRKLANLPNEVFPAMNLASSITGEIVLKAFFGEDIAQLSLNGQDPSQCVTQLITRFGQLTTESRFFQIKRALLEEKVFSLFPRKIEQDLYELNTVMLDHMKKAIKNRMEKLKNCKNIEHQDYLDVYLDVYLNKNDSMDPPITEDEILQQSITLYFAGTETTANLVTTACYFLAENQLLQEEIYQEILEVLNGELIITAKHLQNLQKVAGFLMECLRLKPVAPMLISKQALKDLYIKDIFIKKGWYVNYMVLSNAQNQKYFSNPTQIDITRWKADGTLKDSTIDPFAFVPFSAGGRNCIGQYLAIIESKIVISKILLNYKLKLNQKIAKAEWIAKFTYGLSNQDYITWEAR